MLVVKNKDKFKGTIWENAEIYISPVQCFITANIDETFTFQCNIKSTLPNENTATL